MLKYCVLLVVLGVVKASLSGNIPTGSCLCSTTSSLHARTGAGLSHSIVDVLGQGECYLYHGGQHVADGYTWYSLSNVHGHKVVWVAGNYLSLSSDSHCTSTSSHSASTRFAHGLVSQACLQCICQIESGCKPIGCHWDVNSPSCGYFQLKQVYWIDCHSPGSSLESCAEDLNCASQCIQSYMSRYVPHSGCPHTCETYARIHNGGPHGCTHTGTLGYWSKIQSCLSSHG